MLLPIPVVPKGRIIEDGAAPSEAQKRWHLGALGRNLHYLPCSHFHHQPGRLGLGRQLAIDFPQRSEDFFWDFLPRALNVFVNQQSREMEG